jgi:organic radical activating enzyme
MVKSGFMKSDGHIMEIFQGIQGEGIWVGVQQIFLRFFRCNLRCSWCDTPESFALTGKGKVEAPPGSRSFHEFKNPISIRSVMKLLDPFFYHPHHSLSITGGEPLIHRDFLQDLLPLLKKRGETIFLETGGTLPDRLKPLLPFIDILSMDIKLPSSTEEKPFWKEHEEFLKLAAQKQVYIKIVVTKKTVEKEILQALKLIKRVSREIPVILQPVTPFHAILPPTEVQLLNWHDKALKLLSDVRVIPQTHKIIGQH